MFQIDSDHEEDDEPVFKIVPSTESADDCDDAFDDFFSSPKIETPTPITNPPKKHKPLPKFTFGQLVKRQDDRKHQKTKEMLDYSNGSFFQKYEPLIQRDILNLPTEAVTQLSYFASYAESPSLVAGKLFVLHGKSGVGKNLYVRFIARHYGFRLKFFSSTNLQKEFERYIGAAKKGKKRLMTIREFFQFRISTAFVKKETKTIFVVMWPEGLFKKKEGRQKDLNEWEDMINTKKVPADSKNPDLYGLYDTECSQSSSPLILITNDLYHNDLKSLRLTKSPKIVCIEFKPPHVNLIINNMDRVIGLYRKDIAPKPFAITREITSDIAKNCNSDFRKSLVMLWEFIISTKIPKKQAIVTVPQPVKKRITILQSDNWDDKKKSAKDFSAFESKNETDEAVLNSQLQQMSIFQFFQKMISNPLGQTLTKNMSMIKEYPKSDLFVAMIKKKLQQMFEENASDQFRNWKLHPMWNFDQINQPKGFYFESPSQPKTLSKQYQESINLEMYSKYLDHASHSSIVEGIRYKDPLTYFEFEHYDFLNSEVIPLYYFLADKASSTKSIPSFYVDANPACLKSDTPTIRHSSVSKALKAEMRLLGKNIDDMDFYIYIIHNVFSNIDEKQLKQEDFAWGLNIPMIKSFWLDTHCQRIPLRKLTQTWCYLFGVSFVQKNEKDTLLVDYDKLELFPESDVIEKYKTELANIKSTIGIVKLRVTETLRNFTHMAALPPLPELGRKITKIDRKTKKKKTEEIQNPMLDTFMKRIFETSKKSLIDQTKNTICLILLSFGFTGQSLCSYIQFKTEFLSSILKMNVYGNQARQYQSFEIENVKKILANSKLGESESANYHIKLNDLFNYEMIHKMLISMVIGNDKNPSITKRIELLDSIFSAYGLPLHPEKAKMSNLYTADENIDDCELSSDENSDSSDGNE